jgi:hypothetical protein
MATRFIRSIAFLSLFWFFPASPAQAQSDVPRIEAGVQFLGLRLSQPIGEGAAGVGARFGCNFSNHFGLEAEINHFPGGTKLASNFGETQALFGLKAGYARKENGIFAKVRPGFIHFPQDSAAAGRGLLKRDYFALDVGAVAEHYWGNHTYVRFDAGDTIISYGGERYLDTFGRMVSLHARNNFQFSIGFGFHF